MSLKTPKPQENLQPQMPELKFLKTLIFAKKLFKNYKIG